MHSPPISGSCVGRVLILALMAVFVCAVAAQTDRLEWTGLREVGDLTGLETALAEAAADDPTLRLNATTLGYKAALFLASGSLDTPRLGTTQSLKASYRGDSDLENQRRATVEVEFLGYEPGGKRFGERFEIDLVAGVGKTWKIRQVSTEWCRRKPFQARAPESGKFRDFLESARQREERGGGGWEYEHVDIPKPIRIRVLDLDAVDPVDPMVLRLEGTGVMLDDTPVQRAELAERLADYRRMAELVQEEPKVEILVLPDVLFADGIAVLAELSSAGIHQVYLPAPIPPHPGGRVRWRPDRAKPRPPAELFKGK